MQKIEPSQFKIMKWKNGLGTTQEVAIYPESSDFAKGDFYWRLSMANILEKSDFSKFPGYMRLLTVVQGESLKLNGRKIEPFIPIEFSGEETVQCDPGGKEVVDFGIIFRRFQFSARMEVISHSNDQIENLKDFGTGMHFLFCARGSFQYQNIQMKRYEILKFDGPNDSRLKLETDAICIHISLWPKKETVL